MQLSFFAGELAEGGMQQDQCGKIITENIPYSDYGTTFAKEWHQVFFQDPEGNIVEVHQKIS